METMRKLYVVFVLFLLANMLNAQSTNNAIGVRLSAGDGFGQEITFQHGLTDINRVELDLGTLVGNHYYTWNVAGTYQWVWKIGNGFNWFAGVGGKIGTYSWDKNSPKSGGGFMLGALANAGIEYSFPVGIQLGLDYRPEINVASPDNIFGKSLGLSARYQF